MNIGVLNFHVKFLGEYNLFQIHTNLKLEVELLDYLISLYLTFGGITILHSHQQYECFHFS